MKPEDILLDLYNRLTKAVAGWSAGEDDGENTQAQRDHYAGMAAGACVAQRMIENELVKLGKGRGRTW